MPLFMYMCMCWCVNVASVLVYVLEGSIVDLSMSMCMGEAMLPMLMSMCKELGWVIVASVHVHVYVLGGQCCLCSYPGGWVLIPI